MNKKNILVNIAILVVILSFHLWFDNTKQMSAVWTAPFFSAAANLEIGKGFRVDETDILHYKSLSVNDKENYHFIKSDNLENYNHNPIGYSYLIYVAKKIFFWLGDIKAIESLQIMFHLIITLLLFNTYNKYTEKLLVLLLVGINPIFIYFATFPFYYYWQIIPTVIVTLYLINKRIKFGLWILIFSIILAFIFITRPSILFIGLLTLILFLFREYIYYALLAIILCVACIYVFQVPTKKNLWFTMYVGIGAYPNPYVPGLSDNNGYKLYHKYTGKEINVSIGGNYYDDKTVDEFTKITKQEYLSILKSNPLLLIRNAVLNFFQSFSFGYFVDYPLWVSYLSSFLGFIFFILLLIKRHFLWILAIIASSISFTPYYPPIQAYMFGSYILLVGAFIELFNQIEIAKKLNNKLKKLNISK